MFLTVSQLGISIEGYMRSGEKAASIFGVLSYSAITPWSKGERKR